MKTFVQYVIILIVLLFSCVKAHSQHNTQTITIDIDGMVKSYATESSSNVIITVDEITINGKKIQGENISIKGDVDVQHVQSQSEDIKITGSTSGDITSGVKNVEISIIINANTGKETKQEN